MDANGLRNDRGWNRDTEAQAARTPARTARLPGRITADRSTAQGRPLTYESGTYVVVLLGKLRATRTAPVLQDPSSALQYPSGLTPEMRSASNRPNPTRGEQSNVYQMEGADDPPLWDDNAARKPEDDHKRKCHGGTPGQ